MVASIYAGASSSVQSRPRPPSKGFGEFFEDAPFEETGCECSDDLEEEFHVHVVCEFGDEGDEVRVEGAKWQKPQAKWRPRRLDYIHVPDEKPLPNCAQSPADGLPITPSRGK